MNGTAATHLDWIVLRRTMPKAYKALLELMTESGVDLEEYPGDDFIGLLESLELWKDTRNLVHYEAYMGSTYYWDPHNSKWVVDPE